MDQRIFAQLDILERGARFEERPTRGEYNDSSAEYSAYDGQDHGYGGVGSVNESYLHAGNEYAQQPMVLDSYDEQLLRQPDHDDRQASRLDITGHRATVPALNLSQFAFNSTSSPVHEPVLSSPAFNASQRRPAVYEYGRDRHMPSQRPAFGDLDQPTTYQAATLQQLDAEEQLTHDLRAEPPTAFVPKYAASKPASKSMQAKTGPPVVQGIGLVSTHELPDRFRSIFPFPLFNAVQSKCFNTIYRTNDNLVLSGPTGSGKTAVLELAICRLISGFSSGSFKIVYQAPTKSLCSERQRDWQKKFGPLDLQCAELTGDTENAQLRNVQHATIIITTPEKWDSITRKWKDHQKLMQMVKLFLIDEVHILKEERGATLEAVVSRMKSVGSDVRFVALSATVPNSADIATWLGRDSINQQLPAVRERFGEEFRPVRLQKHVCGYQASGNDFAFEKVLNGKLPEVVTKYSQRKPIMVFCFTRVSCVETAKLLATWWATKGPRDRYWSAPRDRIVVGEKDLKETISSGVAFHHAGLQIQDRAAVEKGYLDGEIGVICCTSTLAVGVNLPCHMVIIKGTVSYQGPGGCKEYSDLEVMQMLGRAGRPQFDDSAVAVVMTRMQRVQYYEKMITGQELLESCLHRNLIDHLNAEIGLGTITNASSAKKWLSGTFLYVRLKENPEHYKLEGDAPGRSLDERLEIICQKGIALLEENDLVQATPKLHCTEFGDAMARYYLQFDTMRLILALPPKAKVSEILSAVAQAAEFRDVRFRAGEKGVYKDLNKGGSIKFPIPVNIDQPAHKVSLVIQAVLGAVELPSEDYKAKTEFLTAKATIFQCAHRLVRCIVDCQLYLDDAVSVRNALLLARSLAAQVWDDSPLHMKQLEGVGLVSVRKLAVAGIKTIEDIESAEAHRLEHTLSRNPPYGAQLQEKARGFPKLRVSLKMIGEPFIKKGEHVTVRVRAEIGFFNERVPEIFQKRPVYVCMLAETSDGHKIHFARTSAKKLNKGQEVLFSANLTNASQTIHTYVMCDEVAGTARHAILKPEIPATAFPPPKTAEELDKQRSQIANVPNTSKRRASASKARRDTDSVSDEFGDAGIDDADLAFAETGGFVDIDDLDDLGPKQKKQKRAHSPQAHEDWEPRQLANGKWACNHVCKDKTACKHLCCREGLDKKPKPPKVKQSKKQPAEPGLDPKQTQLNMGSRKKTESTVASAKKTEGPVSHKTVNSREAQELNRLHNSVKSTTPRLPLLGKGRNNSSVHSSKPSFFQSTQAPKQEVSSDYGTDIWEHDDTLSAFEPVITQPASRMSPPMDPPSFPYADDDMLDAEFGGAQPLDKGSGDGHVDLSLHTDEHSAAELEDWQMNEPFDDGFSVDIAAEPERSDDYGPHDKGKGQALSVGASTAASAFVPEQSRRQPEFANGPSASKFFGSTQQPKPKARSRRPSAQVNEEFEKAVQPLVEDAFLAEVADAGSEQVQEEIPPKSPDELEKWFKAEFGTEQFNYVG